MLDNIVAAVLTIAVVAAAIAAIAAVVFGCWKLLQSYMNTEEPVGNKEICSTHWSANDIDKLRHELDKKLFGQHIAKTTITNALERHAKNASPRKALAMVLHGWTGIGKTYTMRILADTLFARGTKSQNILEYSATSDFYDETEVASYKKKLKTDIMVPVLLLLMNCY